MPEQDETKTETKPANEPVKTDASTTDGLADNNLETILSGLRSGRLQAAIGDGRDVSIAYIDRSQRTTYIGGSAEAIPAQPAGHRRARIGDAVLNQVPKRELDRLAYVFVPGSSYEGALHRLREQRVLVLHGAPGTGKRAAALRMLSVVSPGEHPVYELNPDLRLTDLRPNELPPDTRLLLETPGGVGLEGITRFQIDALSQALAGDGRQGALVVVTDRLLKAFPSEARNHTWPWALNWPEGTAAAQHTLLLRHLEFLASVDPALETTDKALADLLNEPSLVALLEKQAPPAELAELAELLLPVLGGDRTLEDALARWSRQAGDQVTKWFTEDNHSPDMDDLLVAVAVFNSAPYAAVSRAAQLLTERLNPKGKEESEPELPPAPEMRSRYARQDPRKVRLEAIHARLIKTTLTGHYGEVQEDAVELKNPAWQEAVLRFVWEFDAIRQPLLGWLKSYGVDSNHAMRIRAAAAIGALGRTNFSAIEADVLRVWADSADENARRSAAQVLGITIWDEGAGAASARLLHYWASQPNKPRWQWTAATAYAGLAGQAYPQQMLADLRLIAGNTGNHPLLLGPIFQAMLNAYEDARSIPERRLRFLEELDEWSALVRSGDQRVTNFLVARTALLGFWVMLWPDKRDRVWRLLLSDIGQPGAAQNLAVTLARRSLNFNQPRRWVWDNLELRRFALDGLEALIREVNLRPAPDEQDQLSNYLSALLAACQDADEDEVDRLRYAAERWAENDENGENPFINLFLP